MKNTFFIALLITITLPAIAQMEPLEISLPQPMFVGTPSNFAVENLEEPLGEARPPFLAPSGTKNVAFEKAVFSSFEPRKGELWRITDGYKEATSYSYVELGEGHQHITIDLEEICTIYALTLWHYHMSARVYLDVVIQISDDPDFIMDVQTVFNNDTDNSLGLGVGEDFNFVETHEGKLIDTKGVTGRYVRLHSKGNTDNEFNHYIEVEVYGKNLD
ncbi:MAG: hypothetical protein WCY58_05730 [Mariniphaga sp.]|nr:hypothetical protein [Mariniphaga sp.]MDD4226787.1 hypothetical protein [Mariniphaga sp.]